MIIYWRYRQFELIEKDCRQNHYYNYNCAIMEGSQIPNVQHQAITVAAFAAKYRSKREVYTFLTIDVKCYLPAPHTLTIYFLKDIITGAKKCKFDSLLTCLL